MLSGRGLCDELITRPEESYRLCCVVVCDIETSRIGAPYIYDISNLRVNVTLNPVYSEHYSVRTPHIPYSTRHSTADFTYLPFALGCRSTIRGVNNFGI